MPKKIYFVCAPIFLYWPVAIAKKIAETLDEDLISGGFIGGPKKYHTQLLKEFGSLADNVIYTHDIEKEWIGKKYDKKELAFFIELLGNEVINKIIIADRHIGHGFVTGGDVPYSPFLTSLVKDKEQYLNYTVGMLNYLYTFLKNNKPDVIYSYAVAGSFTLAMAEISKVFCITFTKLTHTRVNDRVIIDTSPRDEMEVINAKFSEAIANYSNESREFAKEYLYDFRAKQEQPDYQLLQNKIYKSKTTLKYHLKLLAKYVKGSINRSNEFFHTSYLGNVVYEKKVVKGIKSYWKKKPFYGNEIFDKPFIYYPLHVDPEASTMVTSPMQTNQFAVVEAIAKAKPVDCILVVKEHLTMIGRRPKGFYKEINEMPGVYMVNPLESSFTCIKKSIAVVTLTGTAGFEAILLKKPAIFLGAFIYNFIQQGFIETQNLSSLPSVLTNLNNIHPAEDTVLLKLLAAIYEVSFPFNGGLIWSGVSKKRVDDNPKVVEEFAAQLKKYLI